MKLKRSEKWILAVTLLAIIAAIGLHMASERSEVYFAIDENVTLTRGGEQQIAEKININTATVQQLQELEGIGPALAEKIVAYREANGDFRRIEDIAFVSGIGSEKYEAIRDYITVD